MEKLKNYKELIVWQKAIDLVEAIYKATALFPKEELFGLTFQLRRSAVSVPSNIAEGQGRNSTGEFKQFLGIAKGSLAELETQIIIASRLKYIDAELLEKLNVSITEVAKLINGLQRALIK